MKLKTILTTSAFIAPALFAATPVFQNQIGFLPKAIKQMVVSGAASKNIDFKDVKSGETVLTVTVPEAKLWLPAEDSAKATPSASVVDFTEINTPGEYQAYIDGEAVGHPININDYAFEDVTKASLKFFYFQRASTELKEEFAGKYARAMGHPDTSIKYHISTGINDSISTFKSPKGWYDAGDYGKYIVNSGISTYTLLKLYQHNAAYFDTLTWNIPESKNNIPDLLDEIRWNLEWMLTMQDKDGGVFHKLTTLKFAGTVEPAKATAQRFAIGKSLTATWDFVAVMAVAADIYKRFDEAFAKTCAEAAAKGFAWGAANANNVKALYVANPTGVGTGSYADGGYLDEQLWGTTELYRITKDTTVLQIFRKNKLQTRHYKLPGWSNVYGLSSYTVATTPEIFSAEEVKAAKEHIFTLADQFVNTIDNGYGLPIEENDFNWGSNSIIANKGMLLIHAYILSKEQKYFDAAVAIADYILGRNPLDQSYMTGYGINFPHHPHHRPSQGDTIAEPVPGMIVGGANKNPDDASISKYIRENGIKATAKKYCDIAGSYSSNEVAINWNSPVSYLLGSIQAIAATGKTYDITTAPTNYKLEVKINDAPYVFADLTPIATMKKLNMTPTVGMRKIIRNDMIQIERTTANGEKLYFDLKGHRIH